MFRSLPARASILGTCGVVAVVALWLMPAAAQQRQGQGRLAISAQSTPQIRNVSPIVDGMRRTGELRLRMTRDDLQVRGRTHERFDQYYRGVRVFGADVAQQLNGGQIISLYGNVYDDIDIDVHPPGDRPDRPENRPDRPTTLPSGPDNLPAAKPSTRPTTSASTRPSTSMSRPAPRPTPRPMGGAGGRGPSTSRSASAAQRPASS